MRTNLYGAQQPSGLTVVDVTKPGGGCASDVFTDSNAHIGSWFAITALGPAAAAASLTLGSTSIKTVNGAPQSIQAGSLVIGQTYKILTLGSTDFTQVGAATNTVGTSFTATGVGTGTGTVVGELMTFANISVASGVTIYGEFESITVNNGSVIAYRG